MIHSVEAGHGLNPNSLQSSFKDRGKRLHYVESNVPQAGLFLEVEKIKAKGPEEEKLYMLPDTGFQVKTQVDLLLNNLSSGVTLESSYAQLKQDIQGFKTEYLVEAPVFPIVLEKAMYEGEMRLVGNLYAGKPMSDATSEIEREGVVKDSIKKIEKWALNAAPGSMAVMASPAGWSGYQARGDNLEALNKADIMFRHAKEVKYPDSQTYCYQIQPDGSVRGFTLKTDMTYGENKKLLTELGVSPDAFPHMNNTQNGIKEVVANVVFIDPKENKSIEDIANTIRHIKVSETAYMDTMGQNRTFGEMMGLLKNPKALWTLDETTKKLVDEFTDYATKKMANPDGIQRRDLEIALGYTVLQLMDKVRPPVKTQKMEKGSSYTPDNLNSAPTPFDPRRTLKDMQEIGGCAGGGNKDGKMTVQSITPRLADILNPDKEWFNCPKCKYQAHGPVGDQCPGCNLTKEQYAAEEGAVMCD